MDDTGGKNGDGADHTAGVISCRYDRMDQVDAAARSAGMPRSAWVAWTIDRGLAGAGVFSADQVTERRARRAQRSELVARRSGTRDTPARPA